MPRPTRESYDVAILGGGLAGLTLALQLHRARPETSILIAEKRAGPAPEAAFKVGESTVEMSAHYFADVVGMRDHLESEQLPKAGLRFFFPAGDNRDIARRTEWGEAAIPPVPSFQLDRGRFENALADRNRAVENTDLVDGTTVVDVDLDADGHVVQLERGGEASSVRARWVVDASGYAQIIKRKLGLAKDVDHTINSAWLRLANGVDIDDWSDDPEWRARVDGPGIRRLSTNHLMGQGYWVWLIPLASGAISIGIVADPRYHAFDEISTLDAALDWMARHEPQLYEALDGRRDEIEDFLKVEDFAYGAQRVYSPDRWALVGIAGVFIDPFYSPGSDFIAFGNTFVTDLVTRDLDGEDVSGRVDQLNLVFLTWFEAFLRVYERLYEMWGNAQVMTVKIAWDYLIYWCATVPLFFHGKWHDLEFFAGVGEVLQRSIGITDQMQPLLLDWHRANGRPREGFFFRPSHFPALWERHLELAQRHDDEGLARRLAEHGEIVKAVAVVIFHKACADVLGERAPDPQRRINPIAISLDPDRWEADGLFDDAGMTLAEAREKAPGVDSLWLD